MLDTCNQRPTLRLQTNNNQRDKIMIITITEYRYIQAFTEHNREDNFSYVGLQALFEHFTEIENDTDTQLKLDVIGICSEYTEYETVMKVLEAYSSTFDVDDYLDDGFFDEEDAIDAIRSRTTIIMTSSNSAVVQDF